MTPAAQRRARRITERLLAEIEMTKLRETLKVTQAELAQRLKVTQTAISRLESRTDMHLSTLRSYIQALGGEVEIRAVFGKLSVRLTHIASAPHLPRANGRRSRLRSQ